VVASSSLAQKAIHQRPRRGVLRTSSVVGSWKLATVSNALATEKMCKLGDALAHGACYKGEEGPHLLRLAGRSSKKFSLEKKKGAEEQCARGQRTRSR
jgi:hypothetical protein